MSLLQVLAKIADQCPDLKHVVTITEEIGEAEASKLKAAGITTTALKTVEEKGAANRLPPQAGPSSDVAVLMYTSGTTGLPKGVRLSHGNVAALVAATRAPPARAPPPEALSPPRRGYRPPPRAHPLPAPPSPSPQSRRRARCSARPTCTDDGCGQQTKAAAPQLGAILGGQFGAQFSARNSARNSLTALLRPPSAAARRRRGDQADDHGVRPRRPRQGVRRRQGQDRREGRRRRLALRYGTQEWHRQLRRRRRRWWARRGATHFLLALPPPPPRSAEAHLRVGEARRDEQVPRRDRLQEDSRAPRRPRLDDADGVGAARVDVQKFVLGVRRARPPARRRRADGSLVVGAQFDPAPPSSSNASRARSALARRRRAPARRWLTTTRPASSHRQQRARRPPPRLGG